LDTTKKTSLDVKFTKFFRNPLHHEFLPTPLQTSNAMLYNMKRGYTVCSAVQYDGIWCNISHYGI